MQNFEAAYARLNPEQKEAVDTLYGPVMVVAGPGTGKTQIIATRTANILKKTDSQASNIFITTFTEAGVIAIRKRLIQFLGKDAYKVQVSTIHSFASDVIKTFPEKFIQYKAAQAIDEVEALELLKSVLEREIQASAIKELTSEYDPLYYLRTISSKISTLKLEGVDYEKFEASIVKQEADYVDELAEIKPTLKKYEKTKNDQAKHIQKLRELLHLYKAYNEELQKREVYDFNDMIQYVLEMFKQDEELVYYYSEQFQFIMLDEYQDTNNAQNQIIQLLLAQSEDQKNIMVVGDDDQSIYRFQGANIENMLEFSSHFPETKFIVLKHNYRSSPAILESAQALIENNNERLSNKIESIEKQLVASGVYKDSEAPVFLYRTNSDIAESELIVKHVQSYLESGVAPEEIAIIVRSNKELASYTELLQAHDIEVDSKLKTNILDTSIVQFLLKAFRVIQTPYGYESDLIDILRSDILGLSKTRIYEINRALYSKNYTRKFKLGFFEYLSDLQTSAELVIDEELEKILQVKEKFLALHADLSELSVVEVIQKFLDEFLVLEYIESNGDFSMLQDAYTLFSFTKKQSEGVKNFSLEQLLSKIELYRSYNFPIARQILSDTKSGVKVLTAHSSKGLEFEYVIIPGLYTGNWDSKRSRNLIKLPLSLSGEAIQGSDFDQSEEDRRLFFVALTRAKRSLVLSYPAGSGTKPLLESMFIGELASTLQTLNYETTNESLSAIIQSDMQSTDISVASDEFSYIETFLENYKLSASDLNTFIEDPKLFLTRVVFKYPFEDNRFTIFGKVYHRALELFYLKFKKEEKLPEKSYLTATFEYLLQKEVLTHEEYESLLTKGREGLSGYYDLHKESEAPLALEYNFRSKHIFYNDIPLTGKIDKIEKIQKKSDPLSISEGSQIAMFRESVAVVDYKTGKIKSLGTIKGVDRYGNRKDDPSTGKYFRQLLFYKLMCELDRDFSSKFEVAELALDFVEGKDGLYKYVPVEVSFEEYEHFKTELQEARSQISDIGFWKDLLQS